VILRCAFLLLFLVAPLAQAVVPGDRAPEIAGIAMADGRPVKLSELRGKVVYLDFWASWCGPCKVALPRLEQLHEDLAPLGFEVVGVNLDEDEGRAREAAATGGVRYTVLRGVDTKSVAAYEIIKMPGAYLIDRDGMIRYSYQGFSASGFESVRPIVETLVKTGKGPPL
jgi:thiol-disulfide isomerase/thioredoxin